MRNRSPAFSVGMHPGRAAAAFGLVQHRDLEHARLVGVAAQRVLARQLARAAFDIDVRAGRPARQRLAVGRGQAQPDDALGHRRHALDHHGPRDRAGRRLADANGHLHVEQAFVRALRVRAGVPFDQQVLRPAKRGVRHVGEALLRQRMCGSGA
jgi:hypothetical protein